MKSRTLAPVYAVIAFGALAPAAQAACTFGSSGEPSLQQSFNELFGANAPDVVNDCLADGSGPGQDGVWRSVGATSATILLEIAGFADLNNLGIYDPLNPSKRLQIFEGRLGPGSTASLSFAQLGNNMTRVTVSIVGSPAPARSQDFVSEAFGFFLTTPEGNTFFSQSNLNVDHADHSYAYRGAGQLFEHGGAVGTTFGQNDAILAYEDLVRGDNDFQDFVMLVRGVAPIPLPAGALLLGSGLIGLGFGARRRRQD